MQTTGTLPLVVVDETPKRLWSRTRRGMSVRRKPSERGPRPCVGVA